MSFKIFLLMMALTLTNTSFSAEEVSSSQSYKDKIDALNKWQKEHFDLTYHGEYYIKHHVPGAAAGDNSTDNEMRDFSHMQNPTLIYKFAKDWKFLSTAEFKYADYQAGPAFPNRFYRALYSVTHDNILNEKDNGVKLDLGVARRVFDRIAVPNTYGNTRFTTNWTKAIPGGGGKNSGTLFAQYLYNDPKKITASTWKHGIELIPALTFVQSEKLTFTIQDDINFNTPWRTDTLRSLSTTHEAYATWTYKYNDKLSPYFQFHYLHGDDFISPAGYRTDALDYFVGCGYNLTSKLVLTPEFGHAIVADGDGKNLADRVTNLFEIIDFAFYVDYTF